MSCPNVSEPGLLQGFDRGETREEAALHVGDAGAERPIAVDPERPRRRGAVVEHGVHVPDHQHVRPAVAGEPADHEVAELWRTGFRLVLDAFDVPSPGAEPGLAPIRDRVHAIGRERAAVDVDHRLQLCEERGLPARDEISQRVDVHRPDASTARTGGTRE